MLAVIVLDATEHTILRNLAEAGQVPHFSALTKRGTLLSLRSDAKDLDGSVFQTLLTGVGPADHGIYKYRQLIPGTYRFRLSKACDSPIPQIWTVLSQRGRRCCVFDVPKAFASAGYSGRLIGSWGAYSPAAAPSSVPSGLYREIRSRFGAHPQPHQATVPLSPDHYADVEDRLVQAAQTRAEICRWMLGAESPDFFITAFSESHVASHQFWHLRDRNHPMFDEATANRSGRAIERIYRAIDKAIGDILQALPEKAHIVVLTQQGVHNNFTGSHLLPQWLAARRGDRSSAKKPTWLVRAASKLGSPVRNALYQRLPERLVNRWIDRKYRPRGDVFMLPGSEFVAFLRVNLCDREPAGTVPKHAYRATLDQLREDLLQLKNPATGITAVAEVVITHDRYHGPQIDTLPDAIVRWRDDCAIAALECPRHGLIEGGLTFTDNTHSRHTNDGLCVIAGPDVPQRELSNVHNLEDLNATFYQLLGEPVPTNLDGRPIDFSPMESAAIN